MKENKGNGCLAGFIVVMLFIFVGFFIGVSGGKNLAKTTTEVNFRKGDYTLICTIPEGEIVEIKGNDQDRPTRVIVYWNGQEGTVAKQYLEEISPIYNLFY